MPLRDRLSKEGFRSAEAHINPLIIKPHKVGISLQNVYAYVLFGSLGKVSRVCSTQETAIKTMRRRHAMLCERV